MAGERVTGAVPRRHASRDAPGQRRAALVSVLGVLALAAGAGGSASGAARPVGALAQLPSTTVCDVETDVRLCTKARAFKRPKALAVSPDGSFVYVAVDPSAAIITLVRDSKTGSLRQLSGAFGCLSEFEEQCGSAVALQGATSLAVSPDGRHVYVAASGSDSVATLVRQAGTRGLLPALGERQCVREDRRLVGECAHGRLLAGANAVAVTRDGRSLYVAGVDGLASFARDATTGTLAQLDGSDGCVSPDGTDPGRAEIEGNINEDAGEVVCAAGRALVGPSDVAVSPDGRNVYVAASLVSAVAVFVRDRETGAVRQLDGPDGCISGDSHFFEDHGCALVPGLGGAEGVTVSPDGRHVYVAFPWSNAVAAFARDPATGALRQLPGKTGCVSEDGTTGSPETAGVCGDASGLGYATSVILSTDGLTAYVVSSDTLAVFARDVKTGALTQLGQPYGCVSETHGECAKASALSFVASATVSPDGRHVYSAAGGSDDPLEVRPTSNAVAVFQREAPQAKPPKPKRKRKAPKRPRH